jgi:kynurenine formamidase
MRKTTITAAAIALAAASAAAATAVALLATSPERAHAGTSTGLWQVYNNTLRNARYIDLTHGITPGIPVWKGFGPGQFSASVDPKTGKAYTYAKDGFEATAYRLATDQWTENPAKAKALAADAKFPGVSLDALKFLHLQRHILFHGHEPLDTDTTPTLEGEHWLHCDTSRGYRVR